MRSFNHICIFIICCVQFNGCCTRYLIDTQDVIDYENSKVLGIEMMNGDVINYKSDEIIMSKQDKYGILLYFRDGSSKKYNKEEILRISIKQYVNEETIYCVVDTTILALAIILSLL